MNRKPIKDMTWEEIQAERAYFAGRARLTPEQVDRLAELDRAVVDALPDYPDPSDR